MTSPSSRTLHGESSGPSCAPLSTTDGWWRSRPIEPTLSARDAAGRRRDVMLPPPGRLAWPDPHGGRRGSRCCSRDPLRLDPPGSSGGLLFGGEPATPAAAAERHP